MRFFARSICRFIPVALASALTWFSFIATAAEEADPKGLSSLEAFESRYEEIVEAVEAGRLTDEVGREAKDLWVSLHKEVLELNARIEAFKLEAREYDGPRQEQALEELTQAVAERERTLARYTHLLDWLAAQHEGVVHQPLAEDLAQEAKPKGEPGFKIEFRPEDLTNPAVE